MSSEPIERMIPAIVISGVVASRAAHARAWIETYFDAHAGEWPAYKEVRAGVRGRYCLEVCDSDIRDGFALAGRTVRRYRKR